MADLVAGGERIEIADHLVRLAHIGAQDPDQVEIDLALLRELHDRDLDAFLVDRLAVGAEAAPADIDDMRRAGEERRPARRSGRTATPW